MDKKGAPHPTRFTDDQLEALQFEATKRGCLVCDVLRSFAESLIEQQERDYRLLARRFYGKENHVNSVHTPIGGTE
jgi:hypothetical protein